MFNALTTRELRSELDKLSRIYGHAEVRVVHAGNGAKTDGETIWLPPIPESATITSEEMRIFRGYQIHEVAHIRYTDMDYWFKKNKAMKCPLTQHVWNLFEDVFIERRTCEEFAGALKSLEETNDAVMKMGVEKGLEQTPWFMAAAYQVAVECRSQLGYVSTYKGEFYSNMARDGARSTDLVEKYIPLAMKAGDTHETLKLAKRFVKEVKKHLEEEKQEEGEGESKSKQPPKRAQGGSSGGGGEPSEWSGFVKVKRSPGAPWVGAHSLREQLMAVGGYDLAEALEMARKVATGAEVEVAVKSDYAPKMATIIPNSITNAVNTLHALGGLEVEVVIDENEGEGGSDGSGEDEDDGESEGAGGSGSEDDGEDDGKGDGASGDEGDGEDEQEDEEAARKERDAEIRQELEAAVKGNNLNANSLLKAIAKSKSNGHVGDYFVLDTTKDRFEPENGEFMKGIHPKPVVYDAYMKNVSAEVGALSNKLRRALMTMSKTHREGGKQRGRLDRRRLAQVVTGSDRVFAQKIEANAKTTVVTIAVDLSGSMTEYSIDMIKALGVIGESLERAGLDFEILGWFAGPLSDKNNRGSYERLETVLSEVLECNKSHDHIRAAKDGKKFLFRHSEAEPLVLAEIKALKSKMRERKGAIGSLNSLVSKAGSCTPTICALDALRERSVRLKSDYDRQIILFLTDGLPHLVLDPSGFWKTDTYAREARARVEKIKKSGVEVYGVGFGDDVAQLDKFLPGCVKLKSRDLARGLLEQLDKVLLKK